MKTHAQQLFTEAADLSEATQESEAGTIDNVLGYSIHCVSTGTAVGTVKLQCSNTVSEGEPSSWVDITGASQAVGAPGSNFFNVDGAFYRFVKVVYTRTSGTGAMTAILVGKL